MPQQQDTKPFVVEVTIDSANSTAAAAAKNIDTKDGNQTSSDDIAEELNSISDMLKSTFDSVQHMEKKNKPVETQKPEPKSKKDEIVAKTLAIAQQ